VKTLILAVAAVVALAVVGPAAAVIKCPQPDGSVISVPDSMGCATKPELDRQRAEQAAAARRRQAEQNFQATQQQRADFIRASQACAQQANRRKIGREPSFEAVARPDGTVRMLGTAQDRFDYNSSMEQQGHPLNSK
jgi:hypothetical protein